MEPDRPPPLPPLVPAWLDHVAQWSWRALIVIALLALSVAILTTVPLVILPVVLALVLAATLAPLVGALVHRGRSRGVATMMAVGGTTLAIVGVLGLSMVALVEQAGEFGTRVTDGADQVNDAANGTLTLPRDAIAHGASSIVDTVVSVSEALATAGAVTVLSVLLAFYFLRDGAHLWRRVMAHAQSHRAAALSAAGSRAFDVLGGYMIGTAAISFVGAASQAVIMFLLGLPLVLPVFVLSFFGGFIPYIGGAITTLLAFLIAVSVGDPLGVLIMGIWTIVFNLVQGNVVAPLVYGRTTHIHPAIVLVSIPAGAAVAGILGMFIVVPAIGVVATTWRTVLSVMSDHGTVESGAAVESDAAGTDGGTVDAAIPEAT
jgi:predicted PurR-regulated permease PerM